MAAACPTAKCGELLRVESQCMGQVMQQLGSFLFAHNSELCPRCNLGAFAHVSRPAQDAHTLPANLGK